MTDGRPPRAAAGNNGVGWVLDAAGAGEAGRDACARQGNEQ